MDANLCHAIRATVNLSNLYLSMPDAPAVRTLVGPLPITAKGDGADDTDHETTTTTLEEIGKVYENVDGEQQRDQGHTSFHDGVTTKHRMSMATVTDHHVDMQAAAAKIGTRAGGSLALTPLRPPRPKCAWIPVAPSRPNLKSSRGRHSSAT